MILAAFGKELNKQKNVEPTNFLNKYRIVFNQDKIGNDNNYDRFSHRQSFVEYFVQLLFKLRKLFICKMAA